jgi:hypothetical protein
MMCLPMTQTTKHWFEQYAWEVLQHSPHTVALTKHFAAKLITFPHILKMDYCVKGSDVLNSHWDKCLNTGSEYVKPLSALIKCVRSTMCSSAVAVSYLTFRTFFVQYTFPTKLTGDGFADSRSCRPRINTLMNLRVLLTSLFSPRVILPSVD